MTVVQRSGVGRSERGGRQYPKRSKRLYERGRRPTLTRIGEKKTISHRMKGGERKVRLLVADVAQVFDPKTKKYVPAKIKLVAENTANRLYVRRNILTKGAIIETDKGKARVTNRPGQEGQVIAVLV